MRETLYWEYNGHCAYCGNLLGDVNNMQIDHIKPLASGGDNNFSNLFPSCPRCNCIKGQMPLEDFRIVTAAIRKTNKKIKFYYEKNHNWQY